MNQKSLLNCLILLLTISFTPASSLMAYTPDAPIIIDGPSGTCEPKTEICGDGVDQDCNGSDLLCPGNDRDRDGYTSSQDCDDGNRKVYPGVSVSCQASCGTGTQTCQASGSFSTCSCTPLCEATNGGKCYYISKLTGSDSNPGTFNAPWKTYLNFVTYYSTSDRPANWVNLQAGDVVYFMSGVYTETYSYQSNTRAIFFRGLNRSSPVTLKAYPGANPVFSPDQPTSAMYFLQSGNIHIDGLELLDADTSAFKVNESSNIELRNSRIHQTDGVDNHNLAGVFISSSQHINVHHNFIHDNYDRTNADTGGNKTENSRNIVLFRGGHNRIHHNVIFQTPPITATKTGGCITYKHSSDISNATFEVDHNIFWNCAFNAIGSGTWHSRIHHNLIIDSGPITFKDFGGLTHNEDNIVEYNTIVRTYGLSYIPTTAWGAIGNLTYRNNIVTDEQVYNPAVQGIIRVSVYGSDALYNDVIGGNKVNFNSNCYHNPNSTPLFNIFGRNGGNYGVLGHVYDFASWQGAGYGANSAQTNPQLDQFFVPQNSSCANKGWYAGE